MTDTELFITTPKLLTTFLVEELTSLGYVPTSTHTAGVSVRGNMHDAMRLNLHLRCAHRVLFPLLSCSATTAEDVYEQCVRFEWEDVLPVDGYFSVVSSVDTPSIRNTQYANVKLKDAIVDRLRRVYGKRPDTGPLTDAAVVFLYWKQSTFVVYMDTSGVPLSRRGYRVISQQAPLSEVLAAAIVKATRWNHEEVFVNPMCGSGTLAIEAALHGTDTPSQFLRSNFAFMHTLMYDERAWNDIRAGAMAGVRKRQLSIIATDHKVAAVHATRKNAAAAGVLDMMDVRVNEFRSTTVPEGPGVVVLNPEYGERMGSVPHLEELYGHIGDWFKKACTGKRAYIFTGNTDLAKKVGLRTSRRIPMFNGDIECRLCEYEMYLGTRRNADETAVSGEEQVVSHPLASE